MSRPYVAERCPCDNAFHILVPGEHYVGHFTVPMPSSWPGKPKPTEKEKFAKQQENANAMADRYTTQRSSERGVFEKYAAEYERERASRNQGTS